MTIAPLPDANSAPILAYLAENLPGYPFDPDIDGPFVDELLEDFYDLDVLEQIKRFRWYYDNRPLHNIRNARGAIRAWISRARRG